MSKILKNKKEYKNFTTLKTPNAVTRQWSNLYKSSKTGMNQKDVTIEELQYIISTTTNKQVYSEALEVYNQKAKRSNKVSGTSYREYDIYAFSKRNINKAINENKVEIQRGKARKALEQLGIKRTKGGRFDYFLTIEGVKTVNPKSVGVTKKDIEDMMYKNALTLAGGDESLIDKSKLEMAIDKEIAKYEEFQKELKSLNKSKVEDIENKVTENVLGFLNGYNKSTGRKARHSGYLNSLLVSEDNIERKAKLEALIKRLPTSAEQGGVARIMRSNEFLKVWCSDSRSACYDTEWLENRIDEVISIIENHLGEGAEYNTTTGEVTFYNIPKDSKITRTGLHLSNYSY